MSEQAPKPVWASKTLWVNAVALGASVAGLYGLEIVEQAQAEIVAGIMALVNIALRLVTGAPIRKPGAKA